MITTSKPRRRWSQYSLRTLLVLMLVASIGLSWIASELQPYRKQREVANAIISLGGSVQWDSNWPRNEARKHPWLRKVLGDEFFAYPHMVCVCDDVAMEYILELPQPAVLALTGSQATDSGLKRISELTQLPDIRPVWHTG